ncbi:MAG: hypothetical protein WBR26_08175 [Candidatus Acidiferrum sp.]
MAAYSEFLGRRVTVRYRVGEMLLSATGTFSADSGRSIFLEQHVEQRGAQKYFRWEIPYPYIYRVEPEVLVEANSAPIAPGLPRGVFSPKAAAATAGTSSGAAPSFKPLLNVPDPSRSD